MKIGMIGLGRMGAAMVERLLEQGASVYATDVDESARAQAAAIGAEVFDSAAALVAGLPAQSTVWVMVPAQFVDAVLDEILPALTAGSIVIDGGNSAYQDSRIRHVRLAEQGIHFLDCGTSGGVEGARTGASLMIGGEMAAYEKVEPLFALLATKNGYARVGGPGAGHFVKAVHNGIEYGMMGALAEGMALLDEQQEEFALDVAAVFKPYANGSIIAGRLMDWLVSGYQKGLPDSISGEVPVGETEVKMQHLTTLGALPILQASIEQRQQTRTTPSRTGKYIATLRNEFGGHATLPKKESETESAYE